MLVTRIDRYPDDTTRNSKVSNNDIRRLLFDFYESDMDYAEVTFNSDEYSTSQSLYSGLRKSVAKVGLPIEVRLIQGSVYLGRL